MTEITLKNGSKVESGCWFEGAAGWTNSYRVVDLAVHHGMRLDPEDAEIVEWYRTTGDSDSDASDETLNKLEAMTGQRGISDQATEYLENLLPEGWVLRWDDGLTLFPAWMDCAAEGGGCDVNYGDNGKSHVTPCIDHQPENKIRINPMVMRDEFTTYLVALWDESGEHLSGSEEIRYSPAPAYGKVDTGEFWFPETILDERVRKAAERLIRRTRCEGHVDDDAALTSGVGIGEAIYCDGRCA